MRFAFVPFVLLVCSSIYAQNKIDVSHVTSPVYVVNLPEVQTVSGTVSVDNLPAVQPVSGTVNMGNLPVDSSGAVRVASAPLSTGHPVWHELLDAPVDICTGDLIATERSINTDGYSLVGVSLVAVGAPLSVEPVWQFADGEDFRRVTDFRDGLVPCTGSATTRLICRNVGGNVKVGISGGNINCTYGYVVTSIRVYLFP